MERAPNGHRMAAKTTAERVAALRESRKSAGLTRLEVYAHPDDHAAIKEHAAKLQRRRGAPKTTKLKPTR